MSEKGAMDRDKFMKIMMLSTSDSDGEALAALRKANAMLKAAKINWEELLQSASGRASSPAYEYYEEAPDYGPGIDDMLQTCINKVRGVRPMEFIHSLAEQYRKWGRLSPKQVDALRKFYENCRD